MKNKIEALRTARGLSQADFARLLKITEQTLIAIEKGKYTPSLALAFRLAKYFEQNIEDVFLYEETTDEI